MTRFLGFMILLLGGMGSSDARTMEAPAALEGDEAELVRAVYDRANSTVLWSSKGQPTQQARAVIQILRAADTFGLEPEDYAAGLLATAASQLNSDVVAIANEPIRHSAHPRCTCGSLAMCTMAASIPRAAGFELAPSRSDLGLGRDGRLARVPGECGRGGGRRGTSLLPLRLAQGSAALLSRPGCQPRHNEAASQRQSHSSLGRFIWGALDLRNLLIAERDLPDTANATVTGNTLDAALVEALKHFQLRHGLTPDGTLGPSTFAALTTPMAQRVRQIELTLERWRWLPAFTVPPIIVNIPEFRLFAFNTTADRVASILQMPVIVGQAYPSKRTPIFRRQLEVRGVQALLGCAAQHHAARNSARDFAATRTICSAITSKSSEAREMIRPSSNRRRRPSRRWPQGKLRVRQRPGDNNALGLIKFIFPNSHNVYMHSTPARQLFLASKRAFSHGCIRVSDPVALAKYVLQKASTPWDDARIEAAMHDAKSQRVELGESIPVFILYGTAMATEDGQVQFFDDIYGHDRKLEELLSLRPVDVAAPATAQQRDSS